MYVQRTTAYKKYRYKQKNYISIFFHKRILLSPFLAIQEELKEAPSHTVDNNQRVKGATAYRFGDIQDSILS